AVTTWSTHTWRARRPGASSSLAGNPRRPATRNDVDEGFERCAVAARRGSDRDGRVLPVRGVEPAPEGLARRRRAGTDDPKRARRRRRAAALSLVPRTRRAPARPVVHGA